jgi:hypothetical protein
LSEPSPVGDGYALEPGRPEPIRYRRRF